LLALAACGGGDEDAARTAPPERPAIPPAASTALFEYDRGAPLRFRDRGVVNKDYPVPIHDVSFAGAAGRRASAYLVVPPGKGPYPGVVYLHGTGGGRLDMLPQATWLAGRRAVTLSLDSPYIRAGATLTRRGVAALRQDRDRIAQAVVDVRRALDLLGAHPKVDGERLGVVGFSAGAKTAAIVAGVDERVDAAVLASGGAPDPENFAFYAPAALRPQVRRVLEATDAARFLARTHNAALLVQIGRRDELVPNADLNRLAAAARGRKDVRRYVAGHELNEQAQRQQLDWLVEQLGIEGPPVRGALTGPG
jgi:dienelactone hydrolase